MQIELKNSKNANSFDIKLIARYFYTLIALGSALLIITSINSTIATLYIFIILHNANLQFLAFVINLNIS